MTAIAASTSLRGRKLPMWAPFACVAAAILLTLLVFAVSSVSGNAEFGVLLVSFFVLLQTVASFVVEGRRQAKNRLFTTLIYGAFLAAIVPLVLILWTVVSKGIKAIGNGFLTHSMFLINPSDNGGGAYHAIVGTIEQGLIAAAIAAPLGILAAIYLVEYGRRAPFARLISFFTDIMVGVPSIVAGLFVYTLWILILGFQKSGFAGSLALFIIMLPLVIRSTEEMLRLVPAELREASYALGVPKWKTILRIVLPTALGGIITGVMLGLARAMGETAPLLLLVGSNSKINFNPFSFGSTPNPQMSLPTYINEQFGIAVGNTDSPAFHRAWAAALVLIVIVMLLNGLARLIAHLTSARG